MSAYVWRKVSCSMRGAPSSWMNTASAVGRISPDSSRVRRCSRTHEFIRNGSSCAIHSSEELGFHGWACARARVSGCV
eukprot:scaffold22015_cov78-Phaeocystis_antarctica.AAC.3